MNFGTFQGAGAGAAPGAITRYTQTSTLLNSTTIAVPNGVKRIEALLCGGGGYGSYGGGGFGGCAVIQIPITGNNQVLSVVIGAGATGTSAAGSPTYVVSAGTRYAEVGGGGSGDNNGSQKNGRSGGGGAGGGGPNSGVRTGGNGGSSPIGNVLWMAYTNVSVGKFRGYANQCPPTAGAGSSGIYNGLPGIEPAANGSFGGGGGGGAGDFDDTVPNNWAGGSGGQGGGGGSGMVTATPSTGGAGGIGAGGGRGITANGAGGSLTGVSIWGYTGFANNGSAGGGMLAAGSASPSFAGGLGGGGGGGPGGNGGNGFAAIRFYF